MNITLQRQYFSEDGIFGAVSDENGNPVCVTLEHAFPQPDGTFKPIVPCGVYTCTRYKSPRFGREVFMLQNVPHHDHVEIHMGDYNKNSDGCILVGRRVIPNPDAPGRMITSSVNTLNKFMDLQRDVSSFTLTIKD